MSVLSSESEQSASWSQSCLLLCKQKVYYHPQQTPPLNLTCLFKQDIFMLFTARHHSFNTVIISMSVSPKSSPHLNVFLPKFCICFSSALNKCDLSASVITLTILGKVYKLWHASLHNSLVPFSLSQGLHRIHPSPVLPSQWQITDWLTAWTEHLLRI